jgi:two-component system, OmpR family, alkaline phosphatase synthesis response regulator PhoP
MSAKKRILVVDDEPDFVAIVQSNLEKEGFEVDVAYNGLEGIEKVKASPPDCIVLDVMMPEMDGFKVCQELKKDEKLLRNSDHHADGCCIPCEFHTVFPL